MSGYRNRFFDHEGRVVHYQDWQPDADRAVVILHGGGQHSHANDGIAEAIALVYRVLSPDSRNHGRSDRFADPFGYDDLAGDVVALLDTLGIASAGIIGFSMGGMTALTLAALHPARVRWLVVIDVPPATRESDAAAVRAAQASRPETYPTLDAYLADLRRGAPHMSEDRLRELALLGRVTRRDGGIQPMVLSIVAPTYAAGLDLWDAIQHFTFPTLVVRGAESAVLDADTHQQMVAAMPHGQAATVERAGHYIHGDNPAGFLRVLDAFLTQIDP